MKISDKFQFKKKIISGVKWSSLSQLFKQGCQFIVTVILARLLNPNDFGLIAMATVFTNFATVFSEMGISQALVQKKDFNENDYSTTFWISLIIGALFTAFFFFIAPFITRFYNKPELTNIVKVISLNFVIISFSSVQTSILLKKLDFKTLTNRDILAVFISGITSIILAILGFGVWSLIFQSVIFSVVNSLSLWYISNWRPKLVFSTNTLYKLKNFSINLTCFNAINYLGRNADQFLIGKFIGPIGLGYYSLAYKLMLFPIQNITWVISKVMFPALALIQNDLEELHKLFLKTIKSVSLITFPLMIVFAIVASDFVQIFYGTKWIPCIRLIQIFCLCGMAQSIFTLMGSVLISRGETSLNLKLGVIGALISILSICLGLKSGLNAVAAYYTVSQLIWLPIAQLIVNKSINLRSKYYILKLKPALYLSLFIGIAIIILKKIGVFITIDPKIIFFSSFSFVVLLISIKLFEEIQ